MRIIKSENKTVALNIFTHFNIRGSQTVDQFFPGHPTNGPSLIHTIVLVLEGLEDLNGLFCNHRSKYMSDSSTPKALGGNDIGAGPVLSRSVMSAMRHFCTHLFSS